MYRPRFERVSRLRRFVSRRGKGQGNDLGSLIAEATRLLLLPSLHDVLDDQSGEPMELRLTYACACVMIAELLAQRFAPRGAEEAATAALRQIGAWSGLDDEKLNARVSGTIRQLMETHPEIYQGLCSRFDDAVERAIVLGRPAQGEVMLRLALESFESAIQRLVLGREERILGAGLIRSSGLLRVVTRRPPQEERAPAPVEAAPPADGPAQEEEEAAAGEHPFAPQEQLARLNRPARRPAARARKAGRRTEERAERQLRRRHGALTDLVDRWRRGGDSRSDDPPN